MATPPAAMDWTIGIVGYGEVGRILAEDLRARGVRVLAWDLELAGGGADGLRRHAAAHGVDLAASGPALAGACDLLISAVTASQTLAAAVDSAQGLRRGARFLDLNSASPGTKRRAAARIDAAGGAYVEAAVMTSVPPYRIAVPMLLGGTAAAALQPRLTALGFDARVGSERLGVVSATKMCRSVIVKGLEALVIEAFTSARAYGVESEVLASLRETFPGMDWETQGAYFFQRSIGHGRRRGEEMREVAETVREAGLTPWLSAAAAERHAWMAEQARRGAFGGEGAGGSVRVDDWRVEADRLLGVVAPAASGRQAEGEG